MRCATCQAPGSMSISLTATVHEGACASCWNAWDEHARKAPQADMQRPAFQLKEYRRWQAWRRATMGRNAVPRVACV